MKKRMAGWTAAIMTLVLFRSNRAYAGDFTNPHVVVHIDAKDRDGNVTHWTVELSSVDALRKVLNIDMNTFREERITEINKRLHDFARRPNHS
jgi:hypothetical protein